MCRYSSNDEGLPEFIFGMPTRVSAVTILGSISTNVPFYGRAVLKKRMSASWAAGITYLLETHTGTLFSLDVCVIIEQYFDLIGRLM